MRAVPNLQLVNTRPTCAGAERRIAEYQRYLDRMGWRRQVEDFMTSSGARCLLGTVSDADWERHYAANEDAYSAVVSELQRVDH
jgi:hypothetical protein